MRRTPQGVLVITCGLIDYSAIQNSGLLCFQGRLEEDKTALRFGVFRESCASAFFTFRGVKERILYSLFVGME